MTTSKDGHSIEQWPVADLIPYEANAKIHDPAQVESLCNLIKRFGWTQPIVVDAKGVIIAGHGRRLAAIKLGLERVPTIVRRDLSKAEADALRLADNRVASNSYDTDLLQSELAQLAGESFDLSLLGFNDKELAFLDDSIADMDESVFVTDIQDAVESKKTENEQTAKDLDETAAPIGDAFGFRRLTVSQSRRVRNFMTQIEGETSKKGADALMVFFDNYGV